MKNELTITVIGGDRRQIESIHLLLNMGHKVNAFGFDNLLDSRVNLASEIEEEDVQLPGFITADTLQR